MLADTSQQLNDKLYNIYRIDPGGVSTNEQHGELLHSHNVQHPRDFWNKIDEHSFFSYGVPELNVKLHGQLLIIGVHNFDYVKPSQGVNF